MAKVVKPTGDPVGVWQSWDFNRNSWDLVGDLLRELLGKSWDILGCVYTYITRCITLYIYITSKHAFCVVYHWKVSMIENVGDMILTHHIGDGFKMGRHIYYR